MPLSVGVGMKRTDVAGVRDDAAILELSVPLPLFDRRRSDAEAAAAERDIVDAEATLIERETLAAYATAR